MGQKVSRLEKTPHYLVFIHRIFHADGQVKPGGLDQILEILKRKGRNILYLEHPLHPEFHPYSYIKLNDSILQKENISPRQIPLCWLAEIWSDLRFVTKNISQPTFAITADPLASFSAFLLKKLGKVTDYYFHIIDYSPHRFSNPLFNRFYHFLYQIAIKNAKKVGVVSPRIKEQILHRGVAEKKICLLPNSPSCAELAPFRREIDQRKLFQLVVTCAGIDPKFRLEDTLTLTAQLRIKYPQTFLVIIGLTETNPSYMSHLQELIRNKHWQNLVNFTGFLPLKQNWELIGQSGIGIAFYSQDASHIRFGDSLKIREYAALGLPTVADNLTSTAEEMENNGAGKIAATNHEAAEIISHWWEHPKEYQETAEAALKWAKINDKDALVEKLYQEVLA